jgi:hypothetical protein
MMREATHAAVVVAAVIALFANVVCGAEAEAAADEWSFTVSAYTFVVEDSRDYVSPILTADRGWLHLEARYNYEALDTGSVFAGYNFEWGDEVAIGLTPMLGGVFGDTSGVAPGYRFFLNWKRLEFYSEGEYLFDLDDDSDSFFYAWTELSYSLTDSLRAGLALQRTRAYDSDLDFQPGVLLGVSWKKLDFTAYAFDSGLDAPTLVFAVGISF